jgi:4-hydroxybenzoate polyprenyltransferase
VRDLSDAGVLLTTRRLPYERSRGPAGVMVQVAPSLWTRLVQRVAPYAQLARWDKPTGVWLLYLPGAWSIALAAGLESTTSAGHGTEPPVQPTTSPVGSLRLQGAFLAGAFLLRGAGCTINDLWDRDIDKQTIRTRQRPLASGRLHLGQGLGFAAAQTLAGFPILLWISTPAQQRAQRFGVHQIRDLLHSTTFLTGVTALVPATLYPLAKRVTMWPQAVLGLTFNWGVLLGWSAATDGSMAWRVVLPLYGAGWCWTLVYDTIYAHQDKYTDRRLGVGSTALRFGEVHAKTWLRGFAAGMVASLTLVGVVSEQPWPFYAGVTLVGAQLFHQIQRVRLDDPADCMRHFRRMPLTGLVLLLGIAGANAWRQRVPVSTDTEAVVGTQSSG